MSARDLLPFSDLPPPEPPKWREHSGAKWIADHPQEWEFAKYLLMEQLITNVLELARQIVDTLPSNPERTVALRKLLEAKDCAVRALLFKE